MSKDDDDQDDLFGWKKARAARDEGIERVLKKNEAWRRAYHAVVQTIPSGTILSAEDARRKATPIIGEPTVYNAWGGAWQGVLRRGYVIKTGRMVTPKGIRSHGRAIQEYRRA